MAMTTYQSQQRGFLARLRDLVNGIFSVWIRDREAQSPDAVYERVIGERVRQYADLKRAVAGILYMRNKIEGEIRDRREELARIHTDIARAVAKNDDEVALVLITQKDGLLQDLERSQKELEEVSAECEAAKTNLVKFRGEIRNLEREKVRMLAALANARARKRIQEAFEGLSTEGEMRALESVRSEIERMKAESRIDDVDMDSGLEKRVRAIRDEAKLEAARRELDELKRRMRPAAQLGSAPREVVIDVPPVSAPVSAAR
jgi:phage shock protein A